MTRVCLVGFSLLLTVNTLAAEPEVTPPSPNRADEPVASEFSLSAAARFLDQASLDWTRRRKCFTCHTNFSYLLASPHVAADIAAQREVRGSLEELVEQRWEKQGPRWDAEVVMAAAMLANHDAATTGQLHPTTRKALDRMWTLQGAGGGFDWLKCDWPPMESDDHYGATIAALAVGAAPDNYRDSTAAVAGLDKLRTYFKENPPPTLHHQAMLLWADSYLGDLLTDDQRQSTIESLLAAQRPDGGWALAALGDWERADGTPQDTKTSDGYGTGFVVFALRRGRVPADHEQLQRGVAWLKQNQRESGRWFTRSLHKDSKHFISHAGTAFAVLALTSCE